MVSAHACPGLAGLALGNDKLYGVGNWNGAWTCDSELVFEQVPVRDLVPSAGIQGLQPGYHMLNGMMTPDSGSSAGSPSLFLQGHPDQGW